MNWQQLNGDRYVEIDGWIVCAFSDGVLVHRSATEWIIYTSAGSVPVGLSAGIGLDALPQAVLDAIAEARAMVWQ